MNTWIVVVWFALMLVILNQRWVVTSLIRLREERQRRTTILDPHGCQPPQWKLNADLYGECERCGYVDKSVCFDLPEDA